MPIENSNSTTFTVDFKIFEEEKHIIPGAGFIFLCVLALIMLETIGNFLLFCMILYEKYGMDPKKRTISNQLLSRTIYVQIFCNIFIMPLVLLYYIFGAFSKYTNS